MSSLLSPLPHANPNTDYSGTSAAVIGRPPPGLSASSSTVSRQGKLRIIHIINSLDFGGAETMLINLLLRTDRQRFEPSVVALIDNMRVADPLIKAGIPIKVIGMTNRILNPRKFLALSRYLHQQQPHVVQTWMDHSNLIGSVAVRLAGLKTRIIWGIHHSNHIRGVAKNSTQMVVDACARLSRFLPEKIVCCSETSARFYGRRGFDRRRIEVICNGFDLSRFHPDHSARKDLRIELGLPEDTPLIGLAARWDPFKDHETFFKAAALAPQQVHFVLCGTDITSSNHQLMAMLGRLGLVDRCHLLGPRHDVPRIHAAVDILTSSSISEAFPLTLGEAMACGTTAVATDVGDSALIVGDTGLIVPPRQPAALAGAWRKILALNHQQRLEMGQRARQRVCQLFDLDSVIDRYQSLYTSIINGNAAVISTGGADHAQRRNQRSGTDRK